MKQLFWWAWWKLNVGFDRLVCRLRGHTWSDFGDEDVAGWFWDSAGDADCWTRSCTRCFHAEYRDE